MNWESNRRLWNLLVAVHKWLIDDFLYKINHASEITIEDWKPFYDAQDRRTEKSSTQER